MERRDLLYRLVQTGAVASLAGLALPGGARASLARTPSQTEGPFYPVDKPAETDWDLLRRGRNDRAAGEPLELAGRVIDTNGRPRPGAVVEIWQCDSRGTYDHPRAPGREGFDPGFQGYGAARTDASGRYRFLTIVPVPYPGRPPHIHAKIRIDGAEILTTQLYIRGHPDNGRDGIFSSLFARHGDRLAMDLRPATLDGGLRGRTTAFDFVV